MRIIGAPLHLRPNTIREDEEVACAIRLVKGHFDKVQFHLKSRHDCPMPLDNPIFQYALANVPKGVGKIVQRDLWPTWSGFGDADSPMRVGWYVNALDEVKELAERLGAEHAFNAEPQGRSPQIGLRERFDESKGPAIVAAIRTALMEAGPVHYIAPTSTRGTGKSRFAPWMAELGISRICRQTYRLAPDANGIWPPPDIATYPGYAYRRDYRGHWVTAAKDGKCVDKDGRRRQVLTVEQALSCPEASYWNVHDGQFQAVLEQVAGR